MRARTILLLAVSAALVPSLPAHDPITTKLTWSREISRIVYKRCASCHRQGGSAPMSLMNYEEARPWAKAIKEEVLERRMPPWGAVKGFGDFQDDQGLSQEEILLLADWVEGGAPEGDPNYLPLRSLADGGEAKAEANSSALTVQDAAKLERGAVLQGIRPERVPEGAALKVVARKPDGSIEPLLWLRNYNPRWRRTYLYRDPVRLPKGTSILLAPPDGASVGLVFADR